MRRYRYIRARHRIEIDLTWECNLTCFDCNRCCNNIRTKERLSFDQVFKFINESLETNYEWKIIRISGGEPTLHPNFLEIIDIIQQYRHSFEKKPPKLIVYTNGFAARTKNLLSVLPSDIVVMNSNKNAGKPVHHIGHFTVAPKDIRNNCNDDFTLACSLASYCGIGLTPYGFYHCPIAGIIDRVFQYNLGRKSIPLVSDHMFEEMKFLCKYCGFYDMDDSSKIHSAKNLQYLYKSSPISSSWRKALNSIKTGTINKLTPY